MTPTPGAVEARIARALAVIRAEARRRGCDGFVLASPPSPEATLLAERLGDALLVPDAEDGRALADTLAGRYGVAPRLARDLAWRALAAARGAGPALGDERRAWLVVAATHKLALLLDPAPPPARVLPLGDVWAGEIRAVAGDVSLPPVLQGMARETVDAVEDALRAYLEHGHPMRDAFSRLTPRWGRRVLEAIDAASGNRRAPLVPKLTAWTVGVDPATG